MKVLNMSMRTLLKHITKVFNQITMTKDELIAKLKEVDKGHYFDKQGKPIEDIMTWGKLHSDEKYMRIGMTKFSDNSFVSTVWLGINHNFCGVGDPIIFESMYFPTEQQLEEWQERYCTEEEAKTGHQEMVNRVLKVFSNLTVI